MIQKIKKTFKDFINYWFPTPKDVISFFLPIVLAIVLIIPVDYTVTTGGGISNVDKKIKITDAYESEGSFNMSYVKELRGTVFSYLLGKIVPSYKINKLSDISLEDEDTNEYEFRERMFFTTSTDSALKVAFTKANKEIIESSEDIYVIYKDKNADADIEVGDKILEVNGIKINKTEDIDEALKDLTNESKEIDLKVLRNKKELNLKISVYYDNDLSAVRMGIYIAIKSNYTTNPKVTFKFGKSDYGSSAGLMMTLSIYNKLVEEDITKGYKISGTGTIDEEGNVGEIGGVTYKLKGAVSKKSDIFLCPVENYEEAVKAKEDNNYNIDIYKVSTIEDALNILNNLKEKEVDKR